MECGMSSGVRARNFRNELGQRRMRAAFLSRPSFPPCRVTLRLLLFSPPRSPTHLSRLTSTDTSTRQLSASRTCFVCPLSSAIAQLPTELPSAPLSIPTRIAAWYSGCPSNSLPSQLTPVACERVCRAEVEEVIKNWMRGRGSGAELDLLCHERVRLFPFYNTSSLGGNPPPTLPPPHPSTLLPSAFSRSLSLCKQGTNRV